MALKFSCNQCGADIIIKYLQPGDTAECKACGAENTVPENCTEMDEAPPRSQRHTASKDGFADFEKQVAGEGIDAISPILLEQINDEIDNVLSPKKNMWRNILTLFFTLAVFFSLGLFHATVTDIIMIIAVLIIHELGHLIAMRIFGYRNIQMFFIPMLGAAVSGTDTNPQAWKKTVVTLMGPVPGIVLGILALVASFGARAPLWWLQVAQVFLFINVFNLLPIYPLDGGRIMNYLLFSRRPGIETAFRVITLICLALIGMAIKAYLLGLFAVIILLTVSLEYQKSRLAIVLRRQIQDENEFSRERIPDAYVKTIAGKLVSISGQLGKNPKNLASHIQTVWQRAREKRATGGAIVGLGAVYASLLIIGLLGFFVTAGGSGGLPAGSRIERRSLPDGTTAAFMVHYNTDSDNFDSSAVVIGETQLDEGRYHGLHTVYHGTTGRKMVEGHWRYGKPDGEWTEWNESGEIRRIITYANGIAMTYRIFDSTSGALIEIPRKEWTEKIFAIAENYPYAQWDNIASDNFDDVEKF